MAGGRFPQSHGPHAQGRQRPADSDHGNWIAAERTRAVRQLVATGKDLARYHVDRYGDVVENLTVHHSGFPTYEYPLSVLKDGQIASREVVELVKKEIIIDDARPLMFTNWGGGDIGAAGESSLNRALNEIKRDFSEAEYKRLASRVYYVGAGWQKHIVLEISPPAHCGLGYPGLSSSVHYSFELAWADW